jgi:hypothetical protein
MTTDPRAGCGPLHHEDPGRYADEPDTPERDCVICPPGQCPGPGLCGGSLHPDPGHDCPKQEFLEDPITVAYGVGAEMVALVPCAVCDALEAER